MSVDPTERFSDRVDNYIKYRPGYPPEMIEFMRRDIGLTPDWTVADIGSGTGISSRIFLENGNRVFGIEPNGPMREASDRLLEKYPRFEPVDGAAEETKLPAMAVELIFAAQSFHWFCNAKAADEFRRILKPGGFVALVWNERETNLDSFHIEYEDFLKRYGTDYEEVRHDKVTIELLEGVFATRFRTESFSYKQIFDLEGLKGRLVSSSYMPGETADNYGGMLKDLETLFAVHAEIGKITVSYKTKFFYCSI